MRAVVSAISRKPSGGRTPHTVRAKQPPVRAHPCHQPASSAPPIPALWEDGQVPALKRSLFHSGTSKPWRVDTSCWQSRAMCDAWAARAVAELLQGTPWLSVRHCPERRQNAILQPQGHTDGPPMPAEFGPEILLRLSLPPIC